MATPVQLELVAIAKPAPGRGGVRKGAGRKPLDAKARPNVPHRVRPTHKSRHPVHVTMRAGRRLPPFRSELVSNLFKRALKKQAGRAYAAQFQVVHFSIQDDHLHLIVEATVEGSDADADAKARAALRTGISGLAISFARRLNNRLRRKGKVWGDRHHRRDLTTPTEVRTSLIYVLQNWKHHGWKTIGEGIVDFYSSAPRFRGWSGPNIWLVETEPWPDPHERTWLLSTGWKKAGGLLDTSSAPAVKARSIRFRQPFRARSRRAMHSPGSR